MPHILTLMLRDIVEYGHSMTQDIFRTFSEYIGQGTSGSTAASWLDCFTFHRVLLVMVMSNKHSNSEQI